MAVRRHDPLGQPRHLDDRAQLGVGELLVEGWSTSDNTPPEAQILITLALRAAARGPRCTHSAGAVGQPEVAAGMAEVLDPREGKLCRSPWPPVVDRIAPAA